MELAPVSPFPLLPVPLPGPLQAVLGGPGQTPAQGPLLSPPGLGAVPGASRHRLALPPCLARLPPDRQTDPRLVWEDGEALSCVSTAGGAGGNSWES